MGLENSPDSRIVSNSRNETSEMPPRNSENCDNNESYSVDDVCDYVIPQQICDITIDIKKISILELSHCDLTTLPIECKKLNLEHLGLSHNKLKEVPLCLYSGLKFLKCLDLSHNEIERFDMEPECLPFVQIVKLNNNRFENVPKWFLMFKCTHLEEFNYSNNKAKHYKYSKNSINLHIIKLKRLELANSYLIDDDYNFLKVFKSLKYLDISNENNSRSLFNKFREIDDLFVKPKWKGLHVLKLNSLSVPLFPEGICWIYSLKELYMSQNNLSWLPENIEYLANLEVLDVSNNSIVALPCTLLSLEKLKVLKVQHNSIESVPNLSQISSLKVVDLYGNCVDTIPFSAANFDLVDIERNYCDTENIENYAEYEEKKNSLRIMCDEIRYDGPCIVPNVPESPPYDPKDDEGMYAEEYKEYISVFPSNVDEEEDWDLPVKAENRNSDIDSVDENWRGEEDRKRFRTVETSKVYVSEDDWMFADFEES